MAGRRPRASRAFATCQTMTDRCVRATLPNAAPAGPASASDTDTDTDTAMSVRSR